MGINDIKAGGAFIEIGGRFAKLDAALKGAKRRLDKFGTQAIGVGTKFAKLGSLLAVAAPTRVPPAQTLSNSRVKLARKIGGKSD